MGEKLKFLEGMLAWAWKLVNFKTEIALFIFPTAFFLFLKINTAIAQCIPAERPDQLLVEGQVSPTAVTDPTPEVSARNTSQCTVTGAVIQFGFCKKPVDWVGNFLYRKPITVTNLTAQDLLDFQIKIENPIWNESKLALSYHFEVAYSGVVSDFSGFANHGFLRGGASITSGKFGNSLTLDGVNDYIAISSLKLIGVGSIPEITVCAWIKTTDDYGIIVSFDRSEYFRLAVGSDVNGVPGVIHWATTADGGTGTHDLITTSTYNDGKWHFVCGWFKAGANPDKKIYVDGVVVASALGHPGATGLGDDGAGVGGNEPDRFGFVGVGSEAGVFDGTKGPTLYFQGQIDELKIYFRALSDEEIRALFVPKAQPNYFDVRFVWNGQAIPYWLEEDGAFWIKVPFIPAGATTVVWMYYGDPTSSYAGNPAQVFDFWDDFEVFTGWTQYDPDGDGLGRVVQDTSLTIAPSGVPRFFDGRASGHKIEDNDPNGSYKSIGVTLGRNIVVEAWVNRNAAYAGGPVDRVGVIDNSGNGYGPFFRHNLDNVGIDKRTGYSGNFVALSATLPDILDDWYQLVLTIDVSGVLQAHRVRLDRLAATKVREGATSTNDLSYSSFTRVYIFGGYDYWVDSFRIRKWANPFPTYTYGKEEELFVKSGFLWEGVVAIPPCPPGTHCQPVAYQGPYLFWTSSYCTRIAYATADGVSPFSATDYFTMWKPHFRTYYPGWNMIGIPSGITLPISQLSNNLSCKFYEWDEPSQSYFANPSSVPAGSSVWCESGQGVFVDISTGTAWYGDFEVTFSCSKTPGTDFACFNMLSHPFPITVDAQTFVLSPQTKPVVWVWIGGTINDWPTNYVFWNLSTLTGDTRARYLDPFEGFWMRCSVFFPCKVTFTYPASLQPSPPLQMKNEDFWLVKVEASCCGGKNDNLNYFGQHPKARIFEDEFDVEEIVKDGGMFYFLKDGKQWAQLVLPSNLKFPVFKAQVLSPKSSPVELTFKTEKGNPPFPFVITDGNGMKTEISDGSKVKIEFEKGKTRKTFWITPKVSEQVEKGKSSGCATTHPLSLLHLLILVKASIKRRFAEQILSHLVERQEKLKSNNTLDLHPKYPRLK